MRVAGFELARGDDIVLWWLGPGCQHAVVLPSWEQTRAAFDRAARTLPGAAAGAAAIQTSMACLIDPGRPLVVHSRIVDDVVGLVRPFTIGNVAGRELAFTAAVAWPGAAPPAAQRRPRRAAGRHTRAELPRRPRTALADLQRRAPQRSIQRARARAEGAPRRPHRQAPECQQIRGPEDEHTCALTSARASRLAM